MQDCMIIFYASDCVAAVVEDVPRCQELDVIKKRAKLMWNEVLKVHPRFLNR